MRADQQKLRATQKSGMKDEPEDIANDRQLKAPSKQGHEREKSGHGIVKRKDRSRDPLASRK